MIPTDDFLIEEHSIGQLIEEKCSVGQLSDNCICLIADEKSALAQAAVSLMKPFKTWQGALFNAYELEVVQKVELKNHPKIRERIEQHGDNFLLQLSTPADAGKQFIVAKTEESRLMDDLFQMVYAAERVAKEHFKEAIKAFAWDHMDEFVELARNAFDDEEFQAEYLAGAAEAEMADCFGMAAAPAVLAERMEIKGIVTYQQRMEMYGRFLDNLKTYHKRHDPKVAAELDFVISNIDPVTLRRLFLKQSPKLQEKINDHINPQRMAAASTMSLEVRKMASADKTRKNDGRYRLFLVKECEQLMVHFSRKSGFILYLIYLLDRKKNGEKVDTLNISQYKELFGKLYDIVYGVNGETVFTDMMKNCNANSEAHQKSLYIVMKSIRDDVGSTCERMQEPAEPFLIRDIASHLAVLPKRIVLPSEMMALT